MTLTPNALWLILAILLQGGLALGLMFYLGSIRVPLVMSGQVKASAIATDRRGWPEREWAVGNAVDNQFQLPVLFYVGSLLAILVGATLIEVTLAFLFVVLRYAHALIHITDNHVIRRFSVYTAGLVVLCLFWLDLAIRLIATAIGA
jgi:hypothetical protein